MISSGVFLAMFNYLSSDVANDVGVAVGVLFLRVGQDLDGLVLFVVQALQAQHVHLLVVALGIDQALDLGDRSVDLALGRAAVAGVFLTLDHVAVPVVHA